MGTMPVQGNTQPYGLLHGGASVVLAETLGSIGAALHAGPGAHRRRARHQRHPPPGGTLRGRHRRRHRAEPGQHGGVLRRHHRRGGQPGVHEPVQRPDPAATAGGLAGGARTAARVSRPSWFPPRPARALARGERRRCRICSRPIRGSSTPMRRRRAPVLVTRRTTCELKPSRAKNRLASRCWLGRCSRSARTPACRHTPSPLPAGGGPLRAAAPRGDVDLVDRHARGVGEAGERAVRRDDEPDGTAPVTDGDERPDVLAGQGCPRPALGDGRAATSGLTPCSVREVTQRSMNERSSSGDTRLTLTTGRLTGFLHRRTDSAAC